MKAEKVDQEKTARTLQKRRMACACFVNKDSSEDINLICIL